MRYRKICPHGYLPLMLCSAFGKKGRIEDQMITQESNQKNVYVYVQASLLAAAARTTKRQLEESKGKQYLAYMQ